MVTLELRKLWQLHLIDAKLLEIQKQAATLDPGRAVMAQIKALESEYADKGVNAKNLHAEQTDLELQQKGIEDKLKKIDKELYGGSVVSPREVENLEKEIESLKRRRGDMDGRLLELMDIVPPAMAEAVVIEKKIHSLKIQLKEHQKKALELKAQLEESYKKYSVARPKAPFLLSDRLGAMALSQEIAVTLYAGTQPPLRDTPSTNSRTSNLPSTLP